MYTWRRGVTAGVDVLRQRVAGVVTQSRRCPTPRGGHTGRDQRAHVVARHQCTSLSASSAPLTRNANDVRVQASVVRSAGPPDRASARSVGQPVTALTITNTSAISPSTMSPTARKPGVG